MLGGSSIFGISPFIQTNSSDAQLAIFLSLLAVFSCLTVMATFILTRILQKVL